MLKSSNATFLTHQTHQTRQHHAGFITFFENLVLAKTCPFPATRNPPRDRFLRRRSNVIKILVSAQIWPRGTPPQGQTCQYYQGRVQKAASPVRSQCVKTQPGKRSPNYTFRWFNRPWFLIENQGRLNRYKRCNSAGSGAPGALLRHV